MHKELTYYDSIHNLPQFYWDKIHATGDYTYLLKPETKKPKKINLEDIWEKIYNEYINECGLADKFIDYMRLRLEGKKLLENSWLNNNPALRALAEVKFREAISLIGEGNHSVLDVSARVSKHMGFAIRTKECTVAEFRSYLNVVEKDISISNG